METTLFGISYETWSQICQMYLYLSPNSQNKHLQFFPFTKLTKEEKKYIKSEDFFNRYIKNGSFLLKKENHIVTDDFILKSDNSFRSATLLAPLLYLVQQAIGKEIWNKYIDERPKEIQVFYAGDYEKSQPLYKRQYDKFCKTLNIYKEDFDFFIKTDISNFFSSISTDKLIDLIDKKCNKEIKHFSQPILQVYKEFISYCGKGKFACTENSVAASFLSTIVYLEEIDTRLYEYLINNKNISGYQMIRYVDDLYILCSFSYSCNNIDEVYRDIFEYYSSIVREYNLAINSNKCVYNEVKYLNDELKQSLYDERVHNIPFEILETFANNIELFLEKLIEKNLKFELTFEVYNKIFEECLKIDEFEYSSIEIFNEFTYDDAFIDKFPNLRDKLIQLFSGDLRFIAFDPRRFIVLLLKTKNEKIIRKLLNILLNKGHNQQWTVFDSAIAINYLLGRSFIHYDLISVLKNNNVELTSYVNTCCTKSFCQLPQNKIVEKICSLVSSDWKTAFLYFMYCMEKDKFNYLSAYAYFKNFFDRFTALLAFEVNYPESRKKNKPNFAKFYKKGEHTNFYKIIKNSDDILEQAHLMRNQNPINHASAELIDVNIYSKELLEIIEKLKYLVFEYMRVNNVY